MGRSRILVVEDNPVVLKMLEAKLQSSGYDVVVAANSTEVIRATQTTRPDLMLLDLGLPDKEMFNSLPDGIGVLEWVRRLFTDEDAFPIIIHTEDDSQETVAVAQKHQVYAVFKKGGDLNELLGLISQALAKAQAA